MPWRPVKAIKALQGLRNHHETFKALRRIVGLIMHWWPYLEGFMLPLQNRTQMHNTACITLVLSFLNCSCTILLHDEESKAAKPHCKRVHRATAFCGLYSVIIYHQMHTFNLAKH